MIGTYRRMQERAIERVNLEQVARAKKNMQRLIQADAEWFNNRMAEMERDEIASEFIELYRNQVGDNLEA